MLNNQIMKTKTAYISGPITGLMNGNFDAFQNAQRKLEHDGYIVHNPHEIGIEIYQRWSKTPPTTESDKKQMWREFMRVDIRYLMQSDCVFLLDNWESSPGATLELTIAQKLGIPIYYMRDGNEFNVTFQISKFDKIPV